MTCDAVLFDEQWLQSEGARLFVRVARLPEPIRAEVVVTHGLGEHSGRYAHVAEALSRHGFRMWGYDLRGHGRSDGPRGDARRYALLLEDLDLVRAQAARSGRPLFLLGHSMGAQITLNYLLSRTIDCRGAVIASPWLRLAFKPPIWRRVLARVAAHLLPGHTQGTDSIAVHLSRDAAHLSSMADPQLTHHRVSARLFVALQRGGRNALAHAAEFTRPVLLLHGGDDVVTSFAATREFYERAGSADKQFVLYPDAVHETHNDLGREKMLADCTQWIEVRL